MRKHMPGIWVFLRLDPLGNDLQSVTKYESTCYYVSIMFFPTICYPTSRRFFFFIFFNFFAMGLALSSLLLLREYK